MNKSMLKCIVVGSALFIAATASYKLLNGPKRCSSLLPNTEGIPGVSILSPNGITSSKISENNKTVVDVLNRMDEEPFIQQHKIINPSLKGHQTGYSCWMCSSLNILNHFRIKKGEKPFSIESVSEQIKSVADTLPPDRTNTILNDYQHAEVMIDYLTKQGIDIEELTIKLNSNDSSDQQESISKAKLAVDKVITKHFEGNLPAPIAINQRDSHWVTIIGVDSVNNRYLVCDSMENDDAPTFLDKQSFLDKIVNTVRHGDPNISTAIGGKEDVCMLLPKGLTTGKRIIADYRLAEDMIYNPDDGIAFYEEADKGDDRIIHKYEIYVFSDEKGKFVLNESKQKVYIESTSKDCIVDNSLFHKDEKNSIQLLFKPFLRKNQEESYCFINPAYICNKDAAIIYNINVNGKSKIKPVPYYKKGNKFFLVTNELHFKEFNNKEELEEFVQSSDFASQGWYGVGDDISE